MTNLLPESSLSPLGVLLPKEHTCFSPAEACDIYKLVVLVFWSQPAANSSTLKAKVKSSYPLHVPQRRWREKPDLFHKETTTGHDDDDDDEVDNDDCDDGISKHPQQRCDATAKESSIPIPSTRDARDLSRDRDWRRSGFQNPEEPFRFDTGCSLWGHIWILMTDDATRRDAQSIEAGDVAVFAVEVDSISIPRLACNFNGDCVATRR